MKILAADTSTTINTVAVCEDGRILAETTVECGRKHTERLLETVNWVLGEAEKALDSLDALAVSVGPGSFTGLRVGIATFKGLAAGTGLPLAGVPTLDAMTRLVPLWDGIVCPLLDAKMGEVFGARYVLREGQREKLTDDMVCPVEEFLEGLSGSACFLGDGAELYRERIEAACPRAVFAPPICAVPRAAAVASEAEILLTANPRPDAAAVVPVYLRESQAERAREANQP